MPIDKGQTYNVVASNNLPWPVGNLIGLELTMGLAPCWFAPTAGVACVEIVPDKFPHVRPPVILRDKLKCLCLAGMSWRKVVMHLHNVGAKSNVLQHIDFTTIKEYSLFDVPVNEVTA